MGIIFSINREHRKLQNIDHGKVQKRTFKGATRTAVVSSIYDGDTITVITRLHKGEPYAKYSLRLSDIDAPELKPPKTMPNRQLHVTAGQAVRDYLRFFMPVGTVIQIQFEQEEKYGRLLGTIHTMSYSYCKMRYIPTVNVNQHLLDHGLVLQYKGDAKDEFDASFLNGIITRANRLRLNL